MREFMNIVENAQPFMFHATRAENLDSIRAQGLVPNGKEPNWDGYPVNIMRSDHLTVIDVEFPIAVAVIPTLPNDPPNSDAPAVTDP